MLSQILKNIKEKYGSFENPNYMFVLETIMPSAYNELLHEPEKKYTLTDITDINEDVSYYYELVLNEKVWHLSLSMVGVYGILLKVDKERHYKLVDVDDFHIDVEGEIFGLF